MRRAINYPLRKVLLMHFSSGLFNLFLKRSSETLAVKDSASLCRFRGENEPHKEFEEKKASRPCLRHHYPHIQGPPKHF